MFEDNEGEDGLSAQSSYTIDINDSTNIDILAPHPEMFDNKVPLGNYTLKKVYTQLIIALNDVRVQKSTNSTLSAIWNGKSVNTFIAQVKASDVVVDSDHIEFYWTFHNSHGYFWSCDDIETCLMLKLAIEKAIKKSPHYDLASNLFHVDQGIDTHQFVGLIASHTKSNY